MKEWNAIDLHMHTVSGMTRDKTKDNVNFNYVLLQNVLEKYQIKLMAVTNHNKIDLVNYILMRHIIKLNNSNILVGVELDTDLKTGAHIHIAAIFEEKFEENYKVMKEIDDSVCVKSSEKEICFSSDEIMSILGNYNVLMIPHGFKDKGVFKNAGEEQILEALKKVREGFIRIFDSPSDWKLAKVKKFLSDINESNLDKFRRGSFFRYS